jgi:hypothetical protein
MDVAIQGGALAEPRGLPKFPRTETGERGHACKLPVTFRPNTIQFSRGGCEAPRLLNRMLSGTRLS